MVAGSVVSCKADWGPLPVRLQTGAIVYPRGGANGIWWRDEWLAARQWPDTKLQFDHAYILISECECTPFSFVRDVFEERLRVGKNSGAGKVLKLAINSVYGKLAQTVGSGQYASRIWAGMITSGTRAQVLRQMALHKRLDSVLMVATDGVFSTEPHDPGPLQLGGWERTDYPDGVTLVRPGIYWSANGKLRARGIGRDSLDEARDRFAAALHNREERVELPGLSAFIGARLAVRQRRDGTYVRSPRAGQWIDRPVWVSLKPAPKRAPDWTPPLLPGVSSAPYGARASAQTALLGQFLQLLRELTQTA